MLTRRELSYRLTLGAGALALAACSQTASNAEAPKASEGKTMTHTSNIDWANLSEREWKEQLTDAEFRVLRKEGTERPFSSELNDNKAVGTYVCGGCALPLFTSEMKFDSGTGWPSFFNFIEGSLDTKSDRKLFMARTEYHCSRCGGHQGHVFKDGPAPTGLRYCNNGVALDFVEA